MLPARRFEPLLTSGRHYVRTEIDTLQETLEWVAARPDSWRRRVAQQGQEAIEALLTRHTMMCYSHLAIAAAAFDDSMRWRKKDFSCPPAGGRLKCREGAPC